VWPRATVRRHDSSAQTKPNRAKTNKSAAWALSDGTPVTRILIADDHEVVRSGLRAILEAHEGWEAVAEASDGKE
jgi:PleD family two-component response regulator